MPCQPTIRPVGIFPIVPHSRLDAIHDGDDQSPFFIEGCQASSDARPAQVDAQWVHASSTHSHSMRREGVLVNTRESQHQPLNGTSKRLVAACLRHRDYMDRKPYRRWPVADRANGFFGANGFFDVLGICDSCDESQESHISSEPRRVLCSGKRSLGQRWETSS